MTMNLFIAVDNYPAEIIARERNEHGEFVHSTLHERVEAGHHVVVYATSTRDIIIRELPLQPPGAAS